ncbi:hypothetical protein ABG067_004783 [Albugo candida]
MEKSLALVFLVIYASIYMTECSLSTLTCNILPSCASLQKCQTCLLKVAGATRLIPTKISLTENSELGFLVDGPMILYSHVELLCSGRSHCGYMKLDRSGAPITQDVTSKQFVEIDGAQHHCLVKASVSHTASCAACLMETSETEMMGHFLVQIPQSHHTLYHVYVLYTSKEPSKIVVSCQLRQFCHGLTVILPTNDCDSFRKSVPVKGMNRLPLESYGSHRLGEKVALYDTDTRSDAAQLFVDAIKQLTTVDRYCFHASSVRNNTKFCTTCMLSEKDRIILAVRTATVDQVEASEANKKSSVEHLFCLFTNEKVDWENLKSVCGDSKDSEPDRHRAPEKQQPRVSSCGTITPVGSGNDYFVPFDSQFYSFINKPIVKRLGNQIRNAELCFWVQEERKQKEQPDCLNCLFKQGMKLELSLSAALLTITNSKVLDCVEDHSQYGAQHHCLVKASVSHTASCAACLMETSETEMMGHFLVQIPQSHHTLYHVYVLYTSKEPSKIVVSCQLRQFCHGLTVILPTNDCDSFRKSVPVKGMNRLPLESYGSHRLGEKVALYDTDTRSDAAQLFVDAIKQLTTVDRYCFHASSVRNNTKFCTTCMLSEKDRIILAVRTATVDQVEASEANKKSSVEHLFCLFTNEKVDWENLKSVCGDSKDSEPDRHRAPEKQQPRVSSCGTITPVGSGNDYFVPFDSQFYSFINKPIVKRLGNQIRNAELCFWVQEERKQKEQPDCLNCLFKQGMKLELSLSAALLTITNSKVLDCVEDHSQCHPLRDVPIAMCRYEKELQLLALEESKMDVIPDLDLNKEPPPDRHTFALKKSKRDVIPDLDLNKEPHPDRHTLTLEESTRDVIPELDLNREPPPDRHSSRVEPEKTTSYFTGTTPLVIHFNLDEEIELFKCYECVLRYKEVLLMSVKRAYLWITNNAKGINHLSLCSKLCPIKHVPLQNQFSFENFERLQPLSIKDVVFIFCGDIPLKRDVIPDLDLNKEPHPDRHTLTLEESTRDVIPELDLNREPPPDRHSSRVEPEKTTSYFTGTTPLVIHFNLDEEIELFKCYECVLRYKEVLLMSVKRAYLWITNNAKGINHLSLCSKLCPIKHVPLQNQFSFENFERLQPLSIKDVVFIFCGDIPL